MTKTALLAALIALVASSARAAMDCGYPSNPDTSLRKIVLTDNDFQQIAQNDPKVTSQYFNTLKRGDKQRTQICDSRALLRKVDRGTATQDDFTVTFPNWLADYWGSKGTPSEQDKVLQAQLDLAARSWAVRAVKLVPKS